MFDITNQKILHRSYGVGYIEKQNINAGNTYIWVRFDSLDEEKGAVRFRYPDSFADFLQFEDTSLQQKALEEIKREREQKKKEEGNKKKEIVRRKDTARTPPQKIARDIQISNKKNMAYKDWETIFPEYVIIQLEGFMYTAHNDSAEALNDVLDYELFTDTYDRLTTGGPDGAKIGFALENSNYKYIVVEYGQIVDRFDGR